MPRLSRLDLEGLRRCVRPDFANVPGEDLEHIVESSIAGLPHGAAEDFKNALGALGKAVSPTLQRAAPGIAKGAATGASVGGPWGLLIGAGAGLASSALGGGRPARPTAAALTPASTTPPSTMGTVKAPPTATLPTGPGAAATLLSLLQNPTVQQALLSQILGASGAQQVATATGASLPRGAINGLLTQLLANASEGLAESETISDQPYLQDDSGDYLIDPASPEHQAALVLSRLQSVPATGVRPHPEEYLAATDWISESFADSGTAAWLESDEGGETVRFY